LDPNPNATRYVLRDRNGEPLKKQNFANYYIVPKGYSLDDARRFGDYVRAKGGEQQSRDAFFAMGSAFYTGGSQDVQRQYTYADGTPGNPDDPVPAFRHSTSFVLGVVTARSGIPLDWSKYFGGKLNEAKYAKYWLLRRFGYRHTPDINTEGEHGLDLENERSIEHGFIYSKVDVRPGDRAYLDDGREVAATVDGPAPLKNQIGLDGAKIGRQSGGGDVQLAPYRFSRSGDLTPMPAMRALNAAKADDAFTKRYLRGDRDAVDYMHALHRAAYPEPGSDSPNLGEAGDSVRGAPRRGLPGGPAGAAPQLGAGNGLAPWMSEATAAARRALTELTSDKSFVDRYLDGGRKEFDRFQGLMRTAYPEGSAAGGNGAEGGGARTALEPWSPAVSGDSGAGVAPWLRDAFTRAATRAPGVEPDAESTLAPWMDYRKPDWARES
jgi:hypothetical protein